MDHGIHIVYVFLRFHTFMRKLIKLSIIALAILATLSSSIYFVLATESDSHLMSEDKIITEIETKILSDVNTISMTPLAKSKLVDCRNDASCIVPTLLNLAKSENQQTVLNTFSEITNALKQSAVICHKPGHALGKFLYRYTDNLSQALLVTNRACGGSIYHGIMQQYFGTKLLSDNGIPSFIVASKACDELTDVSYSQIRSECIHGVGHGLVVANNFDVVTAMKKCEEFEDVFAQRSCLEGASMENAHKFRRMEEGNLENDDVFFPCSMLNQRYAGACYHFHSIYILKKVNGSVEDAFKQCDKLQNQNNVKDCYYGIGTINLYINNKLENIVSDCQKGNINYQTYCIQGAVYTISDQIGINQSFEFCNLAPNMFKMNCYESLGEWIHTIHFTKEELKNDCSQVKNTEYYQVCINANPEELGIV